MKELFDLALEREIQLTFQKDCVIIDCKHGQHLIRGRSVYKLGQTLDYKDVQIGVLECIKQVYAEIARLG